MLKGTRCTRQNCFDFVKGLQHFVYIMFCKLSIMITVTLLFISSLCYHKHVLCFNSFLHNIPIFHLQHPRCDLFCYAFPCSCFILFIVLFWAQLLKTNDVVSYRIVKTLIIKYDIHANMFAEKKMWVAFAFAGNNTSEIDIVLTRTVNIWTTNEPVKLTAL